MVGLGFVNTTFCYDASVATFSKFFTKRDAGFSQQIIIVGNKKYFACLGPGPCWEGMAPRTCSVSTLPMFPFSLNQFENYSHVGTQTVQNFNGSSFQVEAWVGQIDGYTSAGTPLATVQYFDSSSSSSHINIRGNVLINEPGWVTEVRWFDDAVPGVKQGCFSVPDFCDSTTTTITTAGLHAPARPVQPNPDWSNNNDAA